MLKEVAKKLEEKKRPVMIRISDHDKARMQTYADLYTRGNLSAWLRYAALKFVPRYSELEKKPRS